jgi:hypothetical protein
MGNEMTLIEALHDLRKKIDVVINYSRTFKLQPEQKISGEGQEKMQREISIVYTKLQEAKMWAGKCLEQVGSELPQEYRDEAK